MTATLTTQLFGIASGGDVAAARRERLPRPFAKQQPPPLLAFLPPPSARKPKVRVGNGASREQFACVPRGQSVLYRGRSGAEAGHTYLHRARLIRAGNGRWRSAEGAKGARYFVLRPPGGTTVDAAGRITPCTAAAFSAVPNRECLDALKKPRRTRYGTAGYKGNVVVDNVLGTLQSEFHLRQCEHWFDVKQDDHVIIINGNAFEAVDNAC
ncbi:hypothetical protein HPB50_001423 [Hyalomma asiaticum]|uniref:Uncharacterized protein n=1 Tax=Hyalomma asiaticum TaxID=266040 RepID=A0ACB7TAT3_HYAAI|nr:hypothetical protein HPB50_001423 [Hyalomma asiaticum]